MADRISVVSSEIYPEGKNYFFTGLGALGARDI